MIRTQLYLPEDLYQEIGLLAKQEKKSFAQIVREILSVGLPTKKRKASVGEALKQVASLRAKGPIDLSMTIDSHIYSS